MTDRDTLFRDLRAKLIDGIGPGLYVPASEFEELGVPRSHARQLQTVSRQIVDVEDAIDRARSWADAVSAEQDQQAAIGLNPAALADQLDRPI